MATIAANIDLDNQGNLKVVPNTARPKKSAGDTVKWQTVGQLQGQNFTVTFQTSPFSSSTFNQNNPDSGAPTVAAGTTSYKYSVSAGGKSLDPDVIIDA